VIQTCNDNGGNGELAGLKELPEWPEAVKKDFVEYVRKGGGVYVFHSAENAFVGWKAYDPAMSGDRVRSHMSGKPPSDVPCR
jgi:hypothetical protein